MAVSRRKNLDQRPYLYKYIYKYFLNFHIYIYINIYWSSCRKQAAIYSWYSSPYDLCKNLFYNRSFPGSLSKICWDFAGSNGTSRCRHYGLCRGDSGFGSCPSVVVCNWQPNHDRVLAKFLQNPLPIHLNAKDKDYLNLKNHFFHIRRYLRTQTWLLADYRVLKFNWSNISFFKLYLRSFKYNYKCTYESI